MAMAGTVTKKSGDEPDLDPVAETTRHVGSMRPHGPGQVKELTGKVALVTGGAVRVGRAIALRARATRAPTWRSAITARPRRRAPRCASSRRVGVRAVALRADVARPREARALVAERGEAARPARRPGQQRGALLPHARCSPPPPPSSTGSSPSTCARRSSAPRRPRAPWAGAAGASSTSRTSARCAPGPGYIPYGISKAGVVMLTRGLAVALAPRIQVNAVAPGVVLLPEGFPRESGAPPRRAHPDGPARAARRRGGRRSASSPPAPTTSPARCSSWTEACPSSRVRYTSRRRAPGQISTSAAGGAPDEPQLCRSTPARPAQSRPWRGRAGIERAPSWSLSSPPAHDEGSSCEAAPAAAREA